MSNYSRTTLFLLEVEQRLGLNHCYLVGISGERVDVQFSLSGLKVNIAKRLELSDFLLREFYEHAPISRETLKVAMALAIQIRTHLFDLKIGHIIYTSAQSAFMGPWALELKTLNQTSRGQHLPGCAYDLNKADIAGKDADDMSASGNPDNRLVLFGF